jgi:hypothetical protein
MASTFTTWLARAAVVATGYRVRRVFQAWHLVALVATISLYALLRQLSVPEDAYRPLLDGGIAVVGALYAGALVVIAIGSGERDSGAKALFETYRRAYNRGAFLVVGNAALTTAFLFLLWQLMFFRQVSITAQGICRAFLNDELGSVQPMGMAEDSKPLLRRLPVGQRHLVFKEAATDRLITAVQVVVQPVWRRVDLPEPVLVNCKEKESNGVLKPKP